MSAEPQNYKNHAKFVPAFHYVGAPLLVFVLGWSVRGVFRNPGLDSVAALILALVLALAFFLSRIFAMGVQDRVIRLEERLRMERVLPEELKPRIGEITTEAIIGLRFASDAELPGLVQRVLDGELVTRKDVKLQVKDWRADHQRV